MLENNKIISYEDNIKDLPDYPSDAGYTAAQLKAMFDARSDKEIKEKHNGLIDELVTLFAEISNRIGENEQSAKEYADNAVAFHNEDADAHTDIRNLVSDIARRLNALADSDDITLDQLSEIVEYIKTNREILEIVTQGKVGKEELLQTLSEYIKKSEFSTELIKSTNQELKDVDDYTEEERKLPICTEIVIETLLELSESISTNEKDIYDIKKQVGDFDAALDAAIALCDSYIGGEIE